MPSPIPVFDENQRQSLEHLFRFTLAYLGLAITVGLLVTVYCLRKGGSGELLVVALATGVVGSATGALVSALDRHANGLEDRAGGSVPEPEKTKERFSERMFYWFLARPWLGGVVSVAVFWGILSGELGNSDVSSAQVRPEKVAFWGMLVGLFAKSVLDILRNVPKNIFRQ